MAWSCNFIVSDEFRPVGPSLVIRRFTHRPDEEPDGGEFSFAGNLGEAIERASAAAGGQSRPQYSYTHFRGGRRSG
jgi:hypothetical protein